MLRAARYALAILLYAVPLGATSIYSAGTTSALSVTRYWPIVGGVAASTTEAQVNLQFTFTGTATAMYCKVDVPPGIGSSLAFTFRKTAGATALTCTIADVATTCNITGQSVALAATNLVDFQSVPTGSPVSPVNANCAIVVTD